MITCEPYLIAFVSGVRLQKASSATREISHMRFTSWKGRAMPNVALFVGFVTATREERKKFGDFKAPTIVHCRSVSIQCRISSTQILYQP